jgi:sugar-phosphatase
MAPSSIRGIIEAIWRRWASKHGIDVTALLSQAHGRRAIETVRLFAPSGLDPETEAAWLNQQAAQETTGIAAIKGAASLLSALEAHEWAIVTSAQRLLAEHWLTAAGLPQPTVIIAAEDVAHSKPNPGGYVLAAQHLGCPPSSAVVFEDAQAGLEAGRQAGAKVIGVGGSRHLSHLADAWISDFLQLGITKDSDIITLMFEASGEMSSAIRT